MEEQEEEIGLMKSSSWVALEGSLEESVKVVEDSEDAVYTAEPTSLLVLTPPWSFSSSSSSSSPGPCELTVSFQQRHGHVQQIYVLSTARICEIYGQKEQDGEQEYVCTVRGGIISLADLNLPDDVSETSPRETPKEDLTRADISDTSSVILSAIAELDSATVVQQQISPSEELAGVGKMDLSKPVDESPSLTRRGSEEELFSSFTEAISGKTVDGSIIFEESLDHADWVECPHSPMKSSSSISGDEAEVDIGKSGFYFIDAEGESQHTEHPHVRSLFGAKSNPGKNSSSSSLYGGDIESSGHSSWQEATEEDPTLLKTSMTNVPLHQSLTTEQAFEEARKVEVKEPSDSSKTQKYQVGNDDSGEVLPKAGFCVFEVNEECGSSSHSAVTNSTRANPIPETQDGGLEVAKSRLESTLEVGRDGDMESKSLMEPSVYECEVGLVDADAWTSVTIRLLSMKDKSQVKIHRVVVTYTPGPPIQPPLTSSPSAPFQQGAGASSLLAMLVPGILQMARGLSDQRKAKNLAISSADLGKGESDRVSSQVITDISGVLSHGSPPLLESAPTYAKVSSQNHVAVDKSVTHEVNDKAFDVNDLLKGDSHGTSSFKMASIGGTRVHTGCGGESEAMPPRVELPEVVNTKESREGEQTERKEPGLSVAHQKQDDRIGELVQRLDRLETICLRMESSLNSVLENMDNRLKRLESASPALEHPIWGPAFDTGSFVSATSVHLPSGQTGPGAISVMDSQPPFSMPAAKDVSLGESSAPCLSSPETPCYSCLLSSTSPSSMPPISSALPLWPLSSWPQHLSPDSSSHSSGLTASFVSKSGFMNQSNGSEYQSNGGETYWESRTSGDSETDISLESDQTSYADSCEDLECGCCPESSSPVKPGQLVDNALASALSAFSASFEAQNKDFCKEGEVYHEEDSGEEDSLTSEEQVPLVELDCFSSYFDKAEVTNEIAEKVFMHGYEAIPLSSDKDKVIQEDNFWPVENEKKHQINREDEGLQLREEKIFRALENFVNQTEGGMTAFESSSAVVIHASNEIFVDDSTTPNIFLADLQGVLPMDGAKDKKPEGGDAEAVLKSLEQDVQQNPFLQELASGEGDENSRRPQSAWLEQGKNGKQEETVVSSILSVRGFSDPLDSREDTLLQAGLFPEEWNWFSSEFSPFSSVVDVRDLPEDVPAEKEPQVETLVFKENSSKVAPGQVEPWSLLDNDAPTSNTTQQFGGDFYGKDWLGGQKSQWSLLDEYPSHLGGDNLVEEGFGDDHLQHAQPPSLLHEDISIPPSESSAVIEEANIYSSSASLEDSLSLFGMIQSSKDTDASQSPSSQASKSNPFEDNERLDLSQGSNDVPPLVLLEEFSKDVKHESWTPENTQSLLFHLSL